MFELNARMKPWRDLVAYARTVGGLCGDSQSGAVAKRSVRIQGDRHETRRAGLRTRSAVGVGRQCPGFQAESAKDRCQIGARSYQ